MSCPIKKPSASQCPRDNVNPCPRENQANSSECPKKFDTTPNSISDYDRLHSSLHHLVTRKLQECSTHITPVNFMFPVFITLEFDSKCNLQISTIYFS